MNINELLDELTKRNISLSGRAISKIWGMKETSFSQKKKDNTQIKQKNIVQLEEALGIKLVKDNDSNPTENTLERYFDINIKIIKENCGKKIENIQKKNNLSNRQMSGLLDITEEEYIALLRGKSNINIQTLVNLKQNFKVSIDWFLFDNT